MKLESQSFLAGYDPSKHFKTQGFINLCRICPESRLNNKPMAMFVKLLRAGIGYSFFLKFHPRGARRSHYVDSGLGIRRQETIRSVSHRPSRDWSRNGHTPPGIGASSLALRKRV